MSEIFYKKKSLIDILLIVFLCIVIYFPVLLTLKHEDILYLGDGAWYLNRAVLMVQYGTFDDAFVYTMLYPLLIGFVNRFIGNLVIAGIVVNWLAILGLVLGTYLLARSLYHRAIAWIAVLVIVTNTSIYLSGRLFFPDTLFITLTVWCVLAYRFVIHRPGTLNAILLGVVLLLALYTRLEGAMYAGLIGLAVWSVYQSTGSWKLALRLGGIGSSIVVIGIGLYVLVLLRSVDSNNSASYSLLKLLTMTPPRWDLISVRIRDTLTAGLSHWKLWVWWIAAIGVIWGDPRYRHGQWLCTGLIFLNFVYAFVLSIWPFPRYVEHCLPYVAILFAAALWQMMRYPKFPGRLVAAFLIVAMMVPGIRKLESYTHMSVLAYHESPAAQNAKAVDRWLTEQGWEDTEIFTLCKAMLPYTESHFHLIYRLLTSSDNANSTGWDSPAQLLPYMREHKKLFMACGEEIFYSDWKTYFESGESVNYADQLEQVGQIDQYTFFRVADDH